jgi:glycosyltransferase involved in cell wall biosynthesis
MKVLMLNYEFPPIGGGGGKAHLAILRQFVDQNDLLVDVLTSGWTPGVSVEKLSSNVAIHRVGIHKKNLHYWRKTEVLEWLAKARGPNMRLINKNHYDLVHAFFGLPTGWLCYKTADRLPYIISLRGSDVPGENERLKLEYKLLGPLIKRIWTKAAALVANSAGLKQRALKLLPSVIIDVIPNGVDLGLFQPEINREIPGELKIITVGRLSVTKRFEMLIEAVDILRRNGRTMKLTIVGGGGLYVPLKQLIEQKGLIDIIGLTGRIEAEKMPEIYRQNDIFVTATMQEGMSNAMLEAMASGLPIVTTRCEGVEELIADNGIVVEDSSAESLAGAVDKLAGDRQLLKAMCISARQRAQAFGWDMVARQYVQLYRRVCEHNGRNGDVTVPKSVVGV